MLILSIITIIAIILGPILAVQVDRYLSQKREEKERRLKVFKTLMVTRGAVLSPAHVDALNAIDIEFSSKDEKDHRVRTGWKEYVDHLNHFPREKPTEDEQKRWKERTNELLVELLYVMAKAVGHEYDKTYIKRTAYIPEKYLNIEFEQDFIRKGMFDLFLGKSSIPIEIRSSSTDSGEISSEERLRQLLIEHYEGGKPIKVIIEGDTRSN